MRVGFTTTIPVELLFAGGHTPVDLNNIFIGSPSPNDFIRAAESDGFPRNCCGWIKGIYGVVRAHGFSDIIAVTQGDCSYTQALMEVLRHRGVNAVPFAFPFDRDPRFLDNELVKLATRFGATLSDGERWKNRLDAVRSVALDIDRLTWETGKVTGAENHLWLVGCSDFEGDPAAYALRARSFLSEASARLPRTGVARIGFVGVPPIVSGLHDAFEEAGALVVYNEVARQFAMPGNSATLSEQYLRYTYPYSIFERLDDIKAEIGRRSIDGIVHYVQSFCFRQIEDILLREEIGLPVLTLEGENPGPVDERTRIRIQAFVEMLAG
ncbi:MAG TPA: 2-hydroxyacyl-CoA dehydratase [Candidatus Deferrimicrobiaceae bacterium]